MKLIVGLGNPGPKYTGTRHNVGFEVIDELSKRWSISIATEKHHGWFGVGQVHGERVALMKPTTFMNRSGQAVMAAGRFYQLELTDLMVVVDDLALPVGQIRLRPDGSDGGHNGLRDISQRVGSNQWARLRIGIGARVGIGAQYVLGAFDTDEKPDIAIAIGRSADACECWLREGISAAMNRFNIRVS